MRAVVQRVASASVEVEGRIVSAIGAGLLVLVGLHESDVDSDAEYICRKVLNMRLFPNEKTGKNWDRNVMQRNYGVLLGVRVFEIEDEYGDEPIFDESSKEDFRGNFQDVPMYDECSNEDMDGNNEEEGFEDIGSSYEEQEMSSLSMYVPCIFWEDSEQVLDESYDKKIDDCDFEIEDDAQPCENDLDTPQLDELLVEDGSEVSPPEFALDVQICIALVSNLVQELPKKGKECLRQLIDPLGMVFNQASFEYNVEIPSLHSTKNCLRDALGVCVECYFEDIVVRKGQAKWVTYSHTSMNAVNVHKMKLILKMGYCMKMKWIKEMQLYAYFGAA